MTSNYVSCIIVNGCPLLPPVLSEEQRMALREDRQKAVNIETAIAQRKVALRNLSRSSNVPDSINSSLDFSVSSVTSKLMSFISQALQSVADSSEVEFLKAKIFEELTKHEDEWLKSEENSESTTNCIPFVEVDDSDMESVVLRRSLPLEDAGDGVNLHYNNQSSIQPSLKTLEGQNGGIYSRHRVLNPYNSSPKACSTPGSERLSYSDPPSRQQHHNRILYSSQSLENHFMLGQEVISTLPTPGTDAIQHELGQCQNSAKLNSLSSKSAETEPVNPDKINLLNESQTEDSSLASAAFDLNFSYNSSGNDNSKDPQNNVETPGTPSKLTRRNSYTLESPSPVVVRYLRSIGKEVSVNSCHLSEEPLTARKSSSSSVVSSRASVSRNLNEVWGSSESSSTLRTDFDLCGQGESRDSVGSMSTNISRPRSNSVQDFNMNNVNGYGLQTGIKRVDASWLSQMSRSYNESHSGAKAKLKLPSQYTAAEKAAACKIQGAIRGYLTRRLLRTTKVVELKNTIRDSLLCAFALHTEQPPVTTADLNLHVRLIRQVTAACYEIHSIFFDLTVQEQMGLIRLDRIKASRPKPVVRKGAKKSTQTVRRSLHAGYDTLSTGSPQSARSAQSESQHKPNLSYRPWK